MTAIPRTDPLRPAAVLLAGAFRAETEYVLRRLPGAAEVPETRGRLHALRDGDERLWLLRTGVGPLAAASAVADATARLRPSLVVAFGTAGALVPGLPTGALVLADRLVDAATAEVLHVPADLLRRARACLDARGVSAEVGGIATVDALVEDDVLRDHLHDTTHARVVDMETFAMVRAAHAAGVPAVCVRAVSDHADASLRAIDALKRHGRPPAALLLRALVTEPRVLARYLRFRRGLARAVAAAGGAALAIARGWSRCA